jgi:hypothetical protein
MSTLRIFQDDMVVGDIRLRDHEKVLPIGRHLKISVEDA